MEFVHTDMFKGFAIGWCAAWILAPFLLNYFRGR